MALSTVSDLNYLLKRIAAKQLGDSTYRNGPCWDKLNKRQYMGGSDLQVPVDVSTGTTSSPSFTEAQAGAAASQGGAFHITEQLEYGVVQLSRVAIMKGMKDEHAFVNMLNHQIKRKIQGVKHGLATKLFRDGTGIIGRRASASTNVITLTSPRDAWNFHKGMLVGAASATTSGARTGTTTVASVNRKDGKITLTSAAAISSFADNDYLFPSGAHANSDCFLGLPAWNPATAPTAGESYFSQDRSVDVELLSGFRVTQTGSFEDGIMDLSAEMAHVMQPGDWCMYTHPERWLALSKNASATIQRDNGGDKATFGYKYISVIGAGGQEIKVYPESFAQYSESRLVNHASLECVHVAKDCPEVILHGGQPDRTLESSDGCEIRVAFYGSLKPTEPGDMGVLTHS